MDHFPLSTYNDDRHYKNRNKPINKSAYATGLAPYLKHQRFELIDGKYAHIKKRTCNDTITLSFDGYKSGLDLCI